MTFKRIINEEIGEGENNLNEKFNNREVDVDDQVNVEVVENDEQTSEEEKEAQRKENMDLLMKLYEERDRQAGEIFAGVEDELADSKKGIRDAAKIRGGDYSKISSDLQRELTRGHKNIEAEINDLEIKALDVPRDLESETVSPKEFKIEIPDEIRKLERKTNKLVSEEMNAREALVKKFIENSVDDGINSYFANNYHEAINGKNAREIISYKVEKEIRLAAKIFIETGEGANFGFMAKLETTAFKTKERGVQVEKKYITGFTIFIGGYQKKAGENYSPKGKRLLPMSAAINRDNEKRYGGEITKEVIN